VVYLEWIVAGALSAILLILFGLARQGARNSDRLANLTLALLLDEFAYRREREDMLRLIASTKVENAKLLYHTLLFELDHVAEKNVPRASALASRMWQMHLGAAGAAPVQADPVAAGFFQPPGTAMNREEDFVGGSRRRTRDGDRAERIVMLRVAFRIRKALSGVRRRLRNFLLGIK
jgi:hypothetical protein